MKVGTMTRHNSTVQSKSSIKLARLFLWQYAVSNETILELLREVQGKNCLPFREKEISIDFPHDRLFQALTFRHTIKRLLSLTL